MPKGSVFSELHEWCDNAIARVEKLRSEVRAENEELCKLLPGLICLECGPRKGCDEEGCCLSCGADLFFDEDGNPRPSAEPYLHPDGPFGLIDDLRKQVKEAEDGWEEANQRAKDLEQQLYVMSFELEEALEKAKS